MMGSRLREWLMDPVRTLLMANVQPSQNILEVGCGTQIHRLIFYTPIQS
jgi:hypothetical protein